MSVTPSSPSVIESPQHTMALGPWTMALPSLPALPADGRGLAHPASRTEATRIPRQFNSKANGLRILLIQRNPHTRRAGGPGDCHESSSEHRWRNPASCSCSQSNESTSSRNPTGNALSVSEDLPGGTHRNPKDNPAGNSFLHAARDVAPARNSVSFCAAFLARRFRRPPLQPQFLGDGIGHDGVALTVQMSGIALGNSGSGGM